MSVWSWLRGTILHDGATLGSRVDLKAPAAVGAPSGPPDLDEDPPAKVYLDLPSVIVTAWANVNQVRRALVDMDQGQFRAASQLFDAMLTDERVRSAFQQRCSGLLGSDLEFTECGDKRKSAMVVKGLKESWRTMLPPSQLKKLLRNGLGCGVGLGELIWDTSTYTPRLKVWHTQWVRFDWLTRTFRVLTQNEGEVVVTPGDGKWVVYTPYGEQDGWRDALLKSLAVPWLLRQWAARDWGRYSEVHGVPTRVAQVPAGAEPKDKNFFLRQIAQLASESVVRTTRNEDGTMGYDFKLVEATANTWEGFQGLISHSNASISIGVVGQNLTTEAGTGDAKGSLASAMVHDNVRGDLKRDDADTLSACLQEQVVRPWAKYCYGDEGTAPCPEWQVAPPDDLGTKAKTYSDLGDALNKLSTASPDVELDVEEIFEAFSIPNRKRTTPIPAPPPPADPAAPPVKPPAPPAALGAKVPGHVQGQDYADALVAAARASGAGAVAPDLEQLLAVVRSAPAAPDGQIDVARVRADLTAAYRGMDNAQLAVVVERALILAELAGRLSLLQDL